MNVEDVFSDLSSAVAATKFGAAKKLLALAHTDPHAVYPYFDRCITLTRSTNSILQWTGIDLIGSMAAVDAQQQCIKALPLLRRFLHGGKLISTNHAIVALMRIAHAYPTRRTRIVRELLTIENDKFETTECKEIAKGKVVEVLQCADERTLSKPEVKAFVQRAAQSTRPATQKKALKLLHKLQSE